MPPLSYLTTMRRTLGKALIAAAIVVGLAGSSGAQDVTEASLKAAFVYNLAKFTEWPPDALPPGSPMVACVVGDSRIGQALERTAGGRVALGHQVQVVRLPTSASVRSCHVLYAAGLTMNQIELLFEPTRGVPILTVMDAEHVGHASGVARLFVENGKIRFDLDHGLAKRSRLQLSSKLLSLARNVFDTERVEP